MRKTQPLTKRRKELIARIEAAKVRIDRALARLTPEERGEIEPKNSNGMFKRLMKSLKIF